ncbi:MAG: thiol:disulfide interchange protein DsbA/DsbL [Casimicrobiaceae bacterium]
MIRQHPFAPLRGLATTAFAIVALAVSTGALAQDLVEGRNFARIKNPQPVETGKNIEVIEFFSYGCPHCGELEPNLQAWLKNKPADVQLRRIPVMFQPRWENLARVYYTLEAMGEENKLSPEIFTAIHGKGNQLWNEKEFFDWAAAKGLDRKKVEELYASFTVVGKVNRAKQQGQVYQIQSVPTIIVDGKYVTGPERMQNGHAGIPAAIDALVVKARAERPKS